MAKGIRNILRGRSKDPSQPASDGTDDAVSPSSTAAIRMGTEQRGKEKRQDRSASRYDITEGVSIFEVKPFHLGMFQGDELAAVQFRFSELFSAIDVPVRILALSEPYSLQGAVDSAHEMVLSTGEVWRREGLKQSRRFMDELRGSTDLHGIKYYLQAWLPPGIPSNTVQGLATGGFMTRVAPVDPTEPCFRGEYIEERDHLAPLKP